MTRNDCQNDNGSDAEWPKTGKDWVAWKDAAIGHILAVGELTAFQKNIAIAIVRRINCKTGYAFPSRQRLAGDVAGTIPGVRSALHALKKAGCISVEIGGGAWASHYRFIGRRGLPPQPGGCGHNRGGDAATSPNHITITSCDNRNRPAKPQAAAPAVAPPKIQKSSANPPQPLTTWHTHDQRVFFDATPLRRTAKAVVLAIDGRQLTLPLSHLKFEPNGCQIGHTQTVSVPLWLAIKTNLIPIDSSGASSAPVIPSHAQHSPATDTKQPQ